MQGAFPSEMDQNAWAVPCIEAHLRNLTLSTKCIKKSALSLLSMSEHADLISKIWLQTFKTGYFCYFVTYFHWHIYTNHYL